MRIAASCRLKKKKKEIQTVLVFGNISVQVSLWSALVTLLCKPEIAVEIADCFPSQKQRGFVSEGRACEGKVSQYCCCASTRAVLAYLH